MPQLIDIQPKPKELVKDIRAFRRFLKQNPSAERSQFLPFFAKHEQLCAFMATFHTKVKSGTQLKLEADLWSDFTCDLIAGSKSDRAFVFVEFEDAKPQSLFRPKKGRKNSYWGNRVEQGFSQVVDWLFRIDSEGGSATLERDFGARQLNTMGIVITGRSHDVSAYDRLRLDWRSSNTSVGKARVAFFTYDDLLEWLEGRTQVIKLSIKP